MKVYTEDLKILKGAIATLIFTLEKEWIVLHEIDA